MELSLLPAGSGHVQGGKCQLPSLLPASWSWGCAGPETTARLQPVTLSAPQSAFLPASSSEEPDTDGGGADGGGEDVVNGGGIQVRHHCCWQIELLQLPQEVPPPLGFLGEGTDVHLQLQTFRDDGGNVPIMCRRYNRAASHKQLESFFLLVGVQYLSRNWRTSGVMKSRVYVASAP